MPMYGNKGWTIKKYLLCVENSAVFYFPVFENHSSVTHIDGVVSTRFLL